MLALDTTERHFHQGAGMFISCMAAWVSTWPEWGYHTRAVKQVGGSYTQVDRPRMRELGAHEVPHV